MFNCDHYLHYHQRHLEKKMCRMRMLKQPLKASCFVLRHFSEVQRQPLHCTYEISSRHLVSSWVAVHLLRKCDGFLPSRSQTVFLGNTKRRQCRKQPRRCCQFATRAQWSNRLSGWEAQSVPEDLQHVSS